jgi:predicted RNase H-like HicB family nuclease
VLKFEAYHDGEFWCARGIGEDIFTQGQTLDELMDNIREAVSLHFEDAPEVPDVLVLSELETRRAETAAG